MSIYYCAKCKQDVEVDYEYRGIRCSFCGHRILIKKRPTVIRRAMVE